MVTWLRQPGWFPKLYPWTICRHGDLQGRPPGPAAPDVPVGPRTTPSAHWGWLHAAPAPQQGPAAAADGTQRVWLLCRQLAERFQLDHPEQSGLRVLRGWVRQGTASQEPGREQRYVIYPDQTYEPQNMLIHGFWGPNTVKCSVGIAHVYIVHAARWNARLRMTLL